MKLRRIILLLVLSLSLVLLMACGPKGTKLTSLVFEGLEDKTVEFNEPFNVLDGVKAKGNDGKYYNDNITFNSVAIAQGHLDEDGKLDTSIPQSITVSYNVKVDTVEANKFRVITVLGPEAVEGEMVVNSNFELGMAGWNDSAVNYIADGAAMTLSVVDEILNVEFVSGANMYTPRFGQAGITFENGKTYEVLFKAKADATKKINLQVGELLTSDPYFTDFKPKQDERRTITTDWQEFSYKFTMNLDTNENGAILFELGNVDGDNSNTTLYFDYINVVESTPDEDTEGPIFSGLLEEISVTLNSDFDPLKGVSAYDLGDGDVTDDIVVTIYDEDNEEVSAVDTSQEGTYTLEYYVEDSKGNYTEFTVTVNVVDLLFKTDNLVLNGDFKNDLTQGDDTTWELWSQDWGEKPVVVLDHDKVEGKVELDITGGGDASWAVQFTQPESAGLTLELGKTYKVSVKVKAEVERDFNIAVGYAISESDFKEYAGALGLVAKEEETVHEFIFTNTLETHVVKFVFELGATDNFNDGKFTIYEAAIYELDEERILGNEYFQDLGWRGFVNDWDGSVASFNVVDGEYRIDIDFLNNEGVQSWVLQLIQDELALGNLSGEEIGVLNLEPNTTYTLSFDAYASNDATVRVLAAVPVDPWTNFFEDDGIVDITTTKDTYTIQFTTPAEIVGNELFKIELGNAFGGTATDEFIVFDNFVILDEDQVATDKIKNGDFESLLSWTLFNEQGSESSYEVTEDGLLISVTELGEMAHLPHLYQDGFNLNAGDYTLEIKMTSSVDRDLRFNLILPEAGYSSILEGGFHDEPFVKDEVTIITLDFSLDSLTTNVKLEIDLGTLGDDLDSLVGDFLIEYIVLYPRY